MGIANNKSFFHDLMFNVFVKLRFDFETRDIKIYWKKNKTINNNDMKKLFVLWYDEGKFDWKTMWIGWTIDFVHGTWDK